MHRYEPYTVSRVRKTTHISYRMHEAVVDRIDMYLK